MKSKTKVESHIKKEIRFNQINNIFLINQIL